jgi:hypothetical protein
VQDLILTTKTTLIKRARYQLPDGTYITADLPKEFQGGHFGNGLKQFVIYQSQVNNVTQNKILQHLHDIGIQISEGQINAILAQGGQDLKAEYEDVLAAGLKSTNQVQTDDTGARHNKANGFCVVIQNEFFAYYKSTNSKSRMSFLEIMRGKNMDYVLNEPAISYIKTYKFKPETMLILEQHLNKTISGKDVWERFIKETFPPGHIGKNTIKIITEAAIIGSLMTHTLSSDFSLLSDGASQYVLFKHALCWIHMERLLKKIIPASDTERQELNDMREAFWNFYAELKAYKDKPNAEDKSLLSDKFDQIFNRTVTSELLAVELAKIRKHKNELLLVLDRPSTPLHNNASESDIRHYVIKRKISGGTRSQQGREARDIFSSLIKTCRKNKISAWNFLGDRLRNTNSISYLPAFITQRACQSASPP